jgi:hypothetical protein
VAIRRGARNFHRGEHGAGAGLVVHDHGNAQQVCELQGHDSSLPVGTAAGREGDQDADGFALDGKVLGRHHRRDAEQSSAAKKRPEGTARHVQNTHDLSPTKDCGLSNQNVFILDRVYPQHSLIS